MRDDEWDRIKELLPGREGSVGVTAVDNRLFVEAVLYRYRTSTPFSSWVSRVSQAFPYQPSAIPGTSVPWRDLPERFGDWKNVHRRFSRWAKSGVWERMFQHLAADVDERVLKPLAAAGKAAVIPPRSHRSCPRAFDRHDYRERHLIENFFGKIKQFRAIATRYDKTARNFLAAIHLVAATIWLN
ncbi:MAG: transposase [Acetobacteraceae bacterium]